MMRSSKTFVFAACLAIAGCSQAEHRSSSTADGASSPPAYGAAAPERPPIRRLSQEPLIFCDTIQERVSAQDCEDLKATDQMVKDGSAAFNTPAIMYVNQPVSIELAISPGTAAPTAAVSGQPGTVTPYQLKVGRHMTAQLLGQGFKIDPATATDQEVTSSGTTTWEWSVTPLEKGPHTLTLKTAVLAISATGTTYPLVNTIKNEPILIKLTTTEAISDFVNGLPTAIKAITAILVAAAGLAGAYWGLKRAIKGNAGT